MKKEKYIFSCDLCGGKKELDKSATVPEKWKSVLIAYTDQAGHTEIDEKHVCDICLKQLNNI